MHRTTLPKILLATAALAAGAVVPASASADTLLAPAAGAQNLAAGGGWMAWAAPAQRVEGGTAFRLVLRAPDGSVTTPDIPAFEEVPDPSIGSAGFTGSAARALLVVYTRAGDVFELDVRTGRERRVPGVSTGATERAPSVQYGRYAVVRIDGRRPGIYHGAPARMRRFSADLPRELAFNGTRVAYGRGRSVVIDRVSGRGRPFVIGTPTPAESVVMSRYTASWITAGGRVFHTRRFGGSGAARRVSSAEEAPRTLAPGTTAIALRDGRVQIALDGEGVKRLTPAPFGSRG